MPPANSQAGVPLPLPDAFDYVSWMTPPPDVDITVLMDVKARNKHNIVIDTFNNTSIDITRAHMEAARDGTLAAGQDVGPKLKAYFRYTEDELETLVVDNDYFVLVSPVPSHVTLTVFEERRTRKRLAEEKKADDEKAKAKGLMKSLVMVNPIQLSAASRPPPSAPEILLVPLRYGTPLPIWWFTNARLRFATECADQMPTKHQHLTSRDNSAAKVSFVDITKLMKEWGGDDTTESNLLYIWAEATRNYTNAFKSLSADANDLNPHTYGGELEKHFNFFKNVDDAEELFEVWYGTEKELRNKIITACATFEQNFWLSKVQGVVLVHKAAKLISAGSASTTPKRLSDLLLDPRRSSRAFSGPLTRLQQRAQRGPSALDPQE
ncbi:hypothetical protein DFH08DRAFT_1000677 [Mycena albidolilacea]|uniref:Uncharacterized protein n=1 Tax=Mycena albidolilacea TaxID=1033008 RepID=A0AAD7ES04_9AGAR|nr:hypothetical protein DFH08DRAFT_1000677 [Mycena albidolilacea]